MNDRIDLVLALGLDGVHLRANSLPLCMARQLVGTGRLVGISTHSIEEVRQANQDGADYVVFGPIFETVTKRRFGAPLGLEALADACRRSTIPVFAIGGVTSAHGATYELDYVVGYDPMVNDPGLAAIVRDAAGPDRLVEL